MPFASDSCNSVAFRWLHFTNEMAAIVAYVNIGAIVANDRRGVGIERGGSPGSHFASSVVDIEDRREHRAIRL